MTVWALAGPIPGGGIRNESPTALSSPLLAFPHVGTIAGGGWPGWPGPCGKWQAKIGAHAVPGAPHINTPSTLDGTRLAGTIEMVWGSGDVMMFCQVTMSPLLTESGPGENRKSALIRAFGTKCSVPFIVTVRLASALPRTLEVERAKTIAAVSVASLRMTPSSTIRPGPIA